MNSWRKLHQSHKLLSVLLMASILMVTLLPVHFHLHHISDDYSADHSHAVDLHIIGAKSSHTHDDGHTTIVTPSPERVVEKTGSIIVPFVFLIFILLVILFSSNKLRVQRNQNITSTINSYRYFSPPLRAPPLTR